MLSSWLPSKRRALAMLTVSATVIVAALVWVTRMELPGLVHARIADRLASVGVEATFRVAGVELDHVDLADVRVGEDLRIDRVVLRYRPSEILDGRLREVEVIGARCTVRQSAIADLRELAESLASRAAAAPTPVRVSVVRSVVHVDGGPTLRLSADAAPSVGARFTATTELDDVPIAIAGAVLWPALDLDVHASSPAWGSAHLHGTGSEDSSIAWELEGRVSDGLSRLGATLPAGAELHATGSGRLSPSGLEVEAASGSALRAREVRFEGGHRARDVRVRVSGSLRANVDGTRVEGSLELRAGRVRLGRAGPVEHPVVLSGVRVRAPIREGGQRAHVTVRNVSWHGVDLCRAAGGLRLRDHGFSFRGECPLGRTVARISGSVTGRGGRLHLAVPEAPVRRDAPLGRLLAEVVGSPVSGAGGGEATIDLHTGAGSALVGFRSLRLAGIDFGRGGVQLRIGRHDEVTVEDAVAELGGGRVQAAGFRIDTDEIVLSSVRLRGVRVNELLSVASAGKWTGTGVLDGRVAFRLVGEAPNRRLILDGGHLRTRGPGRMHVAESAVARALPSTSVGDRIAATLRDFTYSSLDLSVAKNPGMTSLTARVHGRGRQVPQELSMTLRVRDVQVLVDAAIRHAPPDDTRIRATWSRS